MKAVDDLDNMKVVHILEDDKVEMVDLEILNEWTMVSARLMRATNFGGLSTTLK